MADAHGRYLLVERNAMRAHAAMTALRYWMPDALIEHAHDERRIAAWMRDGPGVVLNGHEAAEELVEAIVTARQEDQAAVMESLAKLRGDVRDATENVERLCIAVFGDGNGNKGLRYRLGRLEILAGIGVGIVGVAGGALIAELIGKLVRG